MITHVQKIAKQAYDNIVLPNEHNELLFPHAILCQVYLPYRDPGTELRIWERRQGKACFAIHTTPVFNPKTCKYDITLGLPFGPKARLVLTHINTLALQQRTPVIEVAETFSSFVTSLGLSRNGKQIAAIKNQLGRLAASMISVAFSPEPKHSFQTDSKIIKGFDLMFPKDDNQRVVWNNTIALSDDYFHSLMNHAVPLDKRHLAVLSNNAMALDIYVWLAQRLHRIEQSKPEFVHWQGLKDQFGDGYDRIDNFKAIFRHTLGIVRTQYNSAKIEEEKNKGFILKCSPPPVPPKTVIQIGENLKRKI
jgi:hypothetical protein